MRVSMQKCDSEATQADLRRHGPDGTTATGVPSRELCRQELAQLAQAEVANGRSRAMQQRAAASVIQYKEREPEMSRGSRGLPEQLKAGIESLSGMRMDGVKVHYNSSRPATLQAHAFAQGGEIHLAPGQEVHLPHEAWHVVQQAQGRVVPTRRLASDLALNDDPALEAEADLMGQRATQLSASSGTDAVQEPHPAKTPVFAPVQRTIFNMGDDPSMAAKDGAALANKLNGPSLFNKLNGSPLSDERKHEHVTIPLPELKSPDTLLVTAVNPFVVMFHGKTLKRMGAGAFLDLLISRGYPRSRGLELVLITCDADSILGADDAQYIANALQSKLRAAKGKVTVTAEGIPVVKVNSAEYREDIFELMGDVFEDFATGWTLYTPQPEKSLGIIALDAKALLIRTRRLDDRATTLKREMDAAPEAADAEALLGRLQEMSKTTAELVETGRSLLGQANAANTLAYRARVDGAVTDIGELRERLDALEQAWKDKHRRLEFRALLDSLEVDSEIGVAWGELDIDVSDADSLELEEKEPDAPSGTVPAHSKQAQARNPVESVGATQQDSVVLLKSLTPPASPVAQAVLTAPDTLLPDGRTLAGLADHFTDIDLVKTGDIALSLAYGAVKDNEFAVTRLLLNGEPSIAFKALTVQNADADFNIEIILSDKVFGAGERNLPQLISTLTHEWELHGLQFARNIHRLKQDKVPDVHLGHGHFFEPGVQAIDRAMHAGILAARPEDRAAIREDYLEDADNHVLLVAAGWTEDDDEEAMKLHTAIRNLQSSWSIVQRIPPENAAEDYDRQQEYDGRIGKLMKAFDRPYFNKEPSTISAELMEWESDSFDSSVTEIWTLLVSVYASRIPQGGELYAASREQLKLGLAEVMLFWPHFMDALKLTEAQGEKERLTAMEQLK